MDEQGARMRTADRVVAVLSMAGSLYVIGWVLNFFMTPRSRQNLPGEVGGLLLIFFAFFAFLAFLNLLAAILVVRGKRGGYIPCGAMMLVGSLLVYLGGAPIHAAAVAAAGIFLLIRYRQSTL